MSDVVLLRVQDLSSGYQRGGWMPGRQNVRERLHGVSLQIQSGQVFGLAGESGSGKSTLARTLAQLLTISSGRIELDGEGITDVHSSNHRQARRRIQLIFQDPATSLSPRRTVRQLLEEPAKHFSLDSSAGRLAQLLEEVGLDTDALDRYPAQFSVGQRQRIAIARALICDPDLLIADEILSPLDVSVQARILRLLQRLTRERGLGLLLISHDLAMLRVIADDLGVMYAGRLVECGPAQRLFDRPAHPYTRMLLNALPRLDPSQPLAPPQLRGGLAEDVALSGCPYAPRCPSAREPCNIAPDPKVIVASCSGTERPKGIDHRVECHFPIVD